MAMENLPEKIEPCAICHCKPMQRGSFVKHVGKEHPCPMWMFIGSPVSVKMWNEEMRNITEKMREAFRAGAFSFPSPADENTPLEKLVDKWFDDWKNNGS